MSVLAKRDYAVKNCTNCYAFGMAMAGRGFNEIGSTYGFNGQEKDREIYNNGNTYTAMFWEYDARIGRRWNLDPKPQVNMSDYSCFGNNPIFMVDPNGDVKDNYTTDENGNIELAEKTNDKFDVLYNKKEYDAGERDYDKSGTKSGIQIDKGQIKSIESKKIIVTDNGGYKIGKLTKSWCEIADENVADNLFQFLDKNTKVEWSNQKFEDLKGNQLNLLSTSQQETTITGLNERTHKYLDKGWNLMKDDHNHPINDNKYKASGDDGDKGYKKELLQRSPNAKFRILYQGKYYKY